MSANGHRSMFLRALPGPVAAAALALAFGVAAWAPPAAAQTYTSGYVQVAVSAEATCALRHDGQVWCWGSNISGELGNGGFTDSLVPVQPSSSARGFGNNNIATIAGHFYTFCALNLAGRAFCWGDNANGGIGDGTRTLRTEPTAVDILGPGVKAISVGWRNTCAISRTDRAFCWGWNAFGQLGDGTNTDRWLPTPVSTATGGFGVRNIETISTKMNESCAINRTGRAFCWGANPSGGVGDGTTDERLVPVHVDTSARGFGVRNIAQVTNGTVHACALNRVGRAYCWGANGNGQLGAGIPINQNSTVPVPVSTSAPGFGLRNIARIVAAPFGTCALNVNGRAFCWGFNGDGQLGDGTTDFRTEPVAVAGLGPGVRDIAPGASHSCAIDAAGDVFCWGRNNRGQLGNGTTIHSLVPVKVAGLP